MECHPRQKAHGLSVPGWERAEESLGLTHVITVTVKSGDTWHSCLGSHVQGVAAQGFWGCRAACAVVEKSLNLECEVLGPGLVLNLLAVCP